MSKGLISTLGFSSEVLATLFFFVLIVPEPLYFFQNKKKLEKMANFFPAEGGRARYGNSLVPAPKKKKEKVRGLGLLGGNHGVSRGVSCRRWSTKCRSRAVVQLNRLALGNSAVILHKLYRFPLDLQTHGTDRCSGR